ncbi:unnamed protein product [Callosobruchus maculatus]|uniref:Uncharacterized protein n=1 Tax=Callosobruchus maculatus TaxID=64391 RepID=A0A653DMU9_CALMS|nr:unnamed protein product [Callosobruchus maculatus]
MYKINYACPQTPHPVHEVVASAILLLEVVVCLQAVFFYRFRRTPQSQLAQKNNQQLTQKWPKPFSKEARFVEVSLRHQVQINITSEPVKNTLTAIKRML